MTVRRASAASRTLIEAGFKSFSSFSFGGSPGLPCKIGKWNGCRMIGRELLQKYQYKSKIIVYSLSSSPTLRTNIIFLKIKFALYKPSFTKDYRVSQVSLFLNSLTCSSLTLNFQILWLWVNSLTNLSFLWL